MKKQEKIKKTKNFTFTLDNEGKVLYNMCKEKEQGNDRISQK